MNTDTEHQLEFDGVVPHNGEYWYKCRRCSASDWISSYGTLDQLNFFDEPLCAQDRQ